MSATFSPAIPATLDDLLQVEGKAELIGGRIIRFMPSGFAPGQAALNIAFALKEHAKRTGRGIPNADGIGFAIRTALKSGRQSFCPDASFTFRSPPANRMRFIEGPPEFAVEVRSEGDYGAPAERELAAKRADYFEAGTQTVWDVDPQAKEIRSYRHDAPSAPQVFQLGDAATAEPALPGWSLAADEVFG